MLKGLGEGARSLQASLQDMRKAEARGRLHHGRAGRTTLVGEHRLALAGLVGYAGADTVVRISDPSPQEGQEEGDERDLRKRQ